MVFHTINGIWSPRSTQSFCKPTRRQLIPRNGIITRNIVNPVSVANGSTSIGIDLECSLREIPSPSVDLNLARNLLVGKLKILGIKFA
jgi:hypothetical protein